MHVLAALLAIWVSVAVAQPSVRASSASVVTDDASPTTATAVVIVENGTMYDVYLVSAATEVAEVVEIREKSRGAAVATAVKEVPVPAFSQLDMSAEGVHLAISKLKRPLKTGESIPLSLVIDNGATLTVQAVVK
jgi:periplasmic copper chaperone A